MYVLIDNILGVVHQKSEDLKTITDNLLSKLYSRVWNWDCSERTYREVFHAVEDSRNLKELNDTLEYEIWFKVLINNQL